MPKIQQIFTLEITPEKFLKSCSPSELQELDMLLAESYFQKRMNSQQCRICGCTEWNCNKCVEKTGRPCYWVEDDLCSACAEDIYPKSITENSARS